MLSLKQILGQADSYEQELPAALPVLVAPRGAEIATWIDHTLLKPEATAVQVPVSGLYHSELVSGL